jgi:hypothetical protein
MEFAVNIFTSGGMTTINTRSHDLARKLRDSFTKPGYFALISRRPSFDDLDALAA